MRYNLMIQPGGGKEVALMMTITFLFIVAIIAC